MDTVNIEKQGLTPLKDELAKVDKITDVKSLVEEFAHLETIGVQTLLAHMPGRTIATAKRSSCSFINRVLACPTAIIILIPMSIAPPFVTIISKNICLPCLS
jgi:putative endopeptidase